MKIFKFRRLIFLILTVLFVTSIFGCTTESTKKRIGILQFIAHPAIDNIAKGIKEGLTDLGYTQANSIIDLQIANGDNALATTIAQKFVHDKCDVIVALITGSAQAAVNVTRGTNVPVVFVAVSDPVGAGVMETNVTGICDALDIEAELGLVKSLLPDAKTIGVIYNAGEINSANTVKQIREMLGPLNLKLETVTITSSADVPMAVDSILGKVDVLVNTLDNTLVSALSVELSRADAKNVPVIASASEQVQAGALASNGFDYYDVGIESVSVIHSVLNGTSPNDIPVENCKKTKMFINKHAADKYNAPLLEGANIV